MIVPPVIERELRTALRKHQAVKSRLRMAMIGAGVACFFLIFMQGDAFWGTALHQMLFFGGLYLAIIPPSRISVGLFCEERRNQTLELLYLTGMGPGELFTGKLLGGVLIASGDLLALTPLIAVPFLSGGLSLDLFWATIVCFPVLLLFTVAVGVLASVLSREDGAALAGAVLLGGAVCLAVPLPYMVGLAVAGVPPFSYHWLCLSPAYGPYLVAKNFAGAKPGEFWLTAGITVVWALAGIGLAAGLLRRNWRQEISRTAPAGWRGKWQSWMQGSASWRATLRERLLPGNPFQWLAEQDRRPLLLARAWIAGTVLFWLLGWAAWPRAWPSPVNFYLTAVVLVGGTRLIMNYAAARQLGMERREGTLELLLTTPLQPAEMVQGQTAALRTQFRPVRLIVFALCVLMMLGGFLTRAWKTPAVISYALIWCFFFGICLHQSREDVPRAMWVALNTGRPTSAVFRLQRGGWWWIWMVFNGRNLWGGLMQARRFPSGSGIELVVVSCIAVFGFAMLVAQKFVLGETRNLLVSDMRFIAQRPVPDAHDPCLKKWDGRGRLPEIVDRSERRIRTV